MIGDTALGSDGIGASGGVAIAEKTNHKTLWTINRYEDSVFENKVKALSKKISEALVMANYCWNRGDKKGWFEYSSHAEKLIKAQEAYGYSKSLIESNILLNEGIDEAWLLILGGGGTAFNNANARLGVGDSTTAEAATQTDLIAGVNKLYKGMNAGFPTSGTQKATWKSDFLSAEANYAWQEFTVDNGAVGLKNLNRKVSAQGTKTAGQTWTLTLDITLS